jgi:hypothetical protein
MFNIFIMRQGVLLVGAGSETRSLWADLKSIPLLIVQFVGYLPSQIIKFIANGQFVYAIGIFVSFGLSVGVLMGTFRGKMSWAYATGIGAWVILFAVTFLAFTVQMIYRRFQKDTETSA